MQDTTNLVQSESNKTISTVLTKYEVRDEKNYDCKDTNGKNTNIRRRQRKRSDSLMRIK